VRFLDFQKVKDAERKQAGELFGTAQEPTALAAQIAGTKTEAFDVVANGGSAAPTSRLSRLKLTDKEKTGLKDLIRKASSLDEIIRLEKALNEGRLPPGIQLEEDGMDEE